MFKPSKSQPIVLILFFLALCLPVAAQASKTLWQIGQTDHSAAEFALAPTNYAHFLERFGKAENAFYPGISSAQTDWPYVLPGPLDQWAGNGYGGRWDQMNTLPIGFVLAAVPAGGVCTFALDLCDTHALVPPTLRIVVNGTVFECELPKGGSDDSLLCRPGAGKAYSLRLEFPAALLRRGYNEIALRSVRGSWLIFDALKLETPAGAELAAPANTVVRSVTAAPYAVSSDRKTPATIRVEVFHAGAPAQLKIAPAGSKAVKFNLESGVHVFEIPAPVSVAGTATPVRLTVNGRSLAETSLELTAKPPAKPADYVSIFNGTAHSRWMIAPGPWMPFSMVKLSPDNQTQGWSAGYDYTQEHIDCFSHIHEWTMAGLGMMPTTGPVRMQPGLDGTGYSSRFDKSTEHAGIGYYEVLLKDTGIQVALTATTRAALQRYTFPASEEARVIFDFLLPNEYEMHVLGATVRRTSPTRIEGVIQTDLPELYYNGEQRYDLHFVAEFNRPFDTLGGWQEGQIQTNRDELKLAGDCGAFVNFKTTAGEKVLVRTGISLVSMANAQLNLDQELAKPFGWDFDAVVQNQRRVWNELFDRVEIETPDAREKSRFYSNFYRALVGRNTWSDVNGEWMDPDEHRQKLADPNAVMLGCDAFWNTFWNLNQVMTLIAPEWSARWVNSEMQLYAHCGWLSKGPAGLEYISVMVAEHEIPLLVGAYQAGVKGVDEKKILEAAVKMQTTLPQKYPGGGWVGNENLENYLKHGYVASDGGVVGQDTKAEWQRPWTSNTYEYSYDDWCLGQLAKAMGRDDLAAQFEKRSQNWRNVFDAQTGFARPRKANGDWVTPFDPYHTPGFVEGNAWQYTWFVPQDVPGLVSAMGRDRFLSRLNEAFEKSAPTRFNAAGERMDQFPINQGNQPTMHAGWLFNWAGEPWMSQKWVRAILDAYYGFNPADAYLGDEDQGQMSAWFIMSSMGLFQTDGGCRKNPIYELGSPLYPKIVLHLSPEHYGGKTFTIEARNASRENRYIQSARLNGHPLNQWWIRQKDVMNGGRLVLELGPKPNPDWAKGCALPE